MSQTKKPHFSDSDSIRWVIAQTVNERIRPRHGGRVARKPTLDEIECRRDRASTSPRPMYQGAYGAWPDDDD